jgi:hypothetical protein
MRTLGETDYIGPCRLSGGVLNIALREYQPAPPVWGAEPIGRHAPVQQRAT